MARRKKQEFDRDRIFSRRALFVGGLQGVLLSVLGARLGWLQVSQGDKYKTLSDKNRINIKLLAPSRGEILDRYGVPLAINNRDFRVVIVPEQTNNLKASLEKLSNIIDIEDSKIDSVIKRAKRSAKYLPLEVSDGLSWEDVAKVEVNLTELAGVQIDVGEVRSYPYGTSTAHLVGYVGAVSKADLSSNDIILSLPGFRIGKTGIEKVLDKQIRGVIGRAEVEVNVSGREVRELSKYPPKAGSRVRLSIDAELQRFVQKRLSVEKSASAVIMDAQTGAIYSMVSHPSFDSNDFVKGMSASKWEELISDPTLPLNNKAVAGQYPPGSTFKMITILAGLEAGVINAYSTEYCKGYYDFGKDRFHCWKRSGHGSVDLVDALAESCDTFFYKISTEIGIDKIADMARRFGLGHKLDFELLEEKAGLVPDKSWKMGKYGEVWHPGETIISSIGQGSIQATPMQLATMTARLVNGGYAVEPWVVGYVGNVAGKDKNWKHIGVNKKHLDLVVKGMYEAVNGKKGTAKASKIEDKKYMFGGKTGTAQVTRITMEQRKRGVLNSELPWKYRHHALFVGYAPISSPKYVCAVVVEHGGGGSSVAAPIAKDILQEVQNRNPASVILEPVGQNYHGSVNIKPVKRPERIK